MKIYLDTLRANGYTIKVTHDILHIVREEGGLIKPEVKEFIRRFPMNEAQAQVIINNTTADINMAIVINDITMATLPIIDEDEALA